MDFRSFLKSRIVTLDGGMGSLLQARGLRPGEAPERWNLTHPDAVLAVQRAYYDAGSNLVIANTFGANPLRFSQEELSRIIPAAIAVARQAAAESSGKQEKFVALDVGPCGQLLAPYGTLGFEDAVRLFSQTVALGAEAGADCVFIETMNDSYETKAALLAAKESCSLPVIVSNAYGADGKLMTGASPEAMVALLEGMGADAVGVNCSLGPEALAPVVRRYLACASVPVLLKPNAGLPRVEDGRTVYDIGPEAFAEAVSALVREGVRLCGGCCGTTPEYIAALKDHTAGLEPVPVRPKEETVVSSYTHAAVFGGRPLLIGERINPTGKKRFRQALAEHDMGYLLSEGIRQQEAGADNLDVNVGAPGLDEPALLEDAVREIQAVLDLPLCIDTSDPVAMERAMRLYNGKPLVNSVNGKQESLDAVLPLVAKYGGTVIALTLDEDGIPPTAEGRVRIARRILDAAQAHGICKKDVVFDTLTMTVSAAEDAAAVTLESLSRIRRELGCHTSLGVSNVSFGLPARERMNAAFFTLALARGLSAGIVNPLSTEMMGAYRSYCALSGLDAHCGEYVVWSQAHPVAAAAAAKPVDAAAETGDLSGLRRAIERGLTAEAARQAAEALRSREPLSLIGEEVIPALNAVGEGFERGRVFLPQLMMAAEAAGSACAEIKAALSAEKTASRCDFVLATVQGDIHDIGKNIVRLLLENYGFAVHDLGKDVPPEDIVDAVVRLHAPLCGLSALMTTTVPAMEETIRRLRDKAPWCRIVVGGAVLTEEYARTIGADAYGRDAMATVRYAEQVDASL